MTMQAYSIGSWQGNEKKTSISTQPCGIMLRILNSIPMIMRRSSRHTTRCAVSALPAWIRISPHQVDETQVDDHEERTGRLFAYLQDKEIRFQSACAPVEEGNVYLPREAPWLPAFKRELQSFPRCTKNDQVDSFSQFLNWTKGNGVYRALGRDHPLSIERRERQRRRR